MMEESIYDPIYNFNSEGIRISVDPSVDKAFSKMIRNSTYGVYVYPNSTYNPNYRWEGDQITPYMGFMQDILNDLIYQACSEVEKIRDHYDRWESEKLRWKIIK
jgi:hypothetical protein